MNHRVRFARPLVVALALMMSVAAADAQTKVKAGFNLFSAEQDVEIGRQSVAEVERQMPVLTDRQVEDYVNRIGRKLAANAGGPQFPYQFRVVNASDINAFALPGGPVYINRGIIDNARNEGEIAGVMAHEIAHVALRHGTHQASKAYAAQAGLSILGGILGGRTGQNTANIINAVGGFGLNVVFLRFSRDLETQADVRGAQILAASGYTPADMVSFFRQLEKVDKAKKTNWLSDHPAPTDRIARIEKELRLLNVTQAPTQNVAELQQVQSRMRSGYGTAPTMAQIARTGGTTSSSPNGPMTSGQPQSSGSSVLQGVEAPSSTLRSYTAQSRAYRVSYPSNWKVYEEGSTGVTFAPQGGIGDANGRTEVVYGAMVNHYDPFGSQQQQQSRFKLRSTNRNDPYGTPITIEQATQDLLGQIQSGSKHLSVVRGSTQRVNVNGGTALTATLRGNNPNTRLQERVTVVTRQLSDDHLVYMLFVTPEKDAAAYSKVLTAMVNSLQVDENAQH
ncbi:MAG: M48 family metalloprotease [Thermoanaerobaculia bacterium]|nr:M48 family metalloprotease [Thermoanaerobaculia bacterium]